MAKILKRERLVPNVHLIEVEAPEIAQKCQPGQFVIIMVDNFGERIPLTIGDWDAKKGSVSSVFLVVGTSTHKLSLLKEGDEVPVFVGPLGRPSKIEKYGRVLLAGGCFGIAAIYPIARALKEAGNKVVTVLDVKANYLIYWEDKLKAVSDKFFVSSRDSYYDCKEYIPRTVEGVVKNEGRIDRAVAIGCTYLMYACSEATKPHNIETWVSLNPIMVDGTGMCGACRVTVGGKTKFACVDGPDFNGHLVDWDELFIRRKSYFEDEIKSLCFWEKKNLP
jgi:ferredoxin--NADP+ reductase